MLTYWPCEWSIYNWRGLLTSKIRDTSKISPLYLSLSNGIVTEIELNRVVHKDCPTIYRKRTKRVSPTSRSRVNSRRNDRTFEGRCELREVGRHQSRVFLVRGICGLHPAEECSGCFCRVGSIEAANAPKNMAQDLADSRSFSKGREHILFAETPAKPWQIPDENSTRLFDCLHQLFHNFLRLPYILIL